jgi:succinate dehydrogenase / fumarate reductase cytochrome b subunit
MEKNTSESKEGILGWAKFKGKGVGYFGFTFQRVSGVVILFYLYLHYTVLSNLLHGQASYNSIVQSITYGPYDLFIVFDVLLALVIFYHGANGIRLALNEMGIGLKHNKAFFVIFESISMVLLLLFLYYAWLFVAA